MHKQLIKKLLIANRGEIACRILKTAKKMAIETVTIFSEADKNSQHVTLADQAICIGPPSAQHSYLNRHKIIEVAKQYHCDAIHPGYGFLAEDSEFAALCEENSIIFVGPSAHAIASMGDKALAKHIMKNANVPTVPGYQEEDQSEKTLQKAAEAIGYPVLIKASAGGGGKGMRLVKNSKEFVGLLQAAKQEAKASFGSDRVLLEKYLQPARHVEVQIFSDQHGNAIYLFDRDCSIQRRHQKIIEEAPAPALSEEIRKKMGESAVRAALAIHYSGAGTIEFLYQDGNFYFMEMNTRLQVEHPVTEMITGQDLVEWQIRVANGEHLPLLQNEISCQGHAIEARICAENPNKNFIPSTGKLNFLRFPTQTESVRIDSGVIEGDSISPYYDSMIAKLIVHAPTRKQAIQKLHEQLAATYLAGPETNISFINTIIQTDAFAKAELSTEFIEINRPELFKELQTLPIEIIALALCTEMQHQQNQNQHLSQSSADYHSPWFCRDSWRLNSELPQLFRFWYQKKCYRIHYTMMHDDMIIHDKQQQWIVQSIGSDDMSVTATINGKSFHAAVYYQNDAIFLFFQGNTYHLQFFNPEKPTSAGKESQQPLVAPMPSTIIAIFVSKGQKVTAGDKLMVLEAMKMQHTILSPRTGAIKEIHFKVGDLLKEGEALLEIE